jgi:REP element-mobilizing transposase RayT
VSGFCPVGGQSSECRTTAAGHASVVTHFALAKILLCVWAMSAPQQIVPGRFYMVTRRTTRRQFLLRPDTFVNNAFLYCLALAAQLTGIEVILPSVMSNHHHTIIFDRHGRLPEFTEHLHKLLARCLNRYFDHEENFWSTDPCCNTHLVEVCDVLDAIEYAATNAIKDNLVTHVRYWPGVNGLSALLRNRTLTATRPNRFFTAEMPAAVTLTLVIPPELGDPALVREAIRTRVETFEDAAARERARTGRRVLGRRAIRAQSPFASPRSDSRRNTLHPHIACRDEDARIEAIQQLVDFQVAYRKARRELLAGTPIPFPYGTYWLCRYVGVAVAPPPN